jgi:hypothetical protein
MSNALLVYLNTSIWTARKLDRTATQEVTLSHSAASDAGRFNKQLLPKEALAPITQIAGAARLYLYDHTRPWSDNGDRVMSGMNYFEVMNQLRVFRAEFNAAVDTFCAAYTEHRERARLKLNTLFNDNDYPHEREVRRKFDMSFGIMPLPTAGDFRVELPDEALEEARAEIEAAVSGRMQAAMADVWGEVRTTVSHLRQRLEETKGGTGRLHDSALTNIEDLIARLPGLNLTNDAGLEDMRKLVATTFNGIEMKDIKKSDAVRADMMAQTDALLKQMGAL